MHYGICERCTFIISPLDLVVTPPGPCLQNFLKQVSKEKSKINIWIFHNRENSINTVDSVDSASNVFRSIPVLYRLINAAFDSP